MTVPMIKSIGDVPYPIDTHSDTFSPLLTAGAALGITGNDAEESAWLTRTSEADGVASVRSIHGNTIVESGALVSVNMTGIETTGFNQWDGEVEPGIIYGNTGLPSPGGYAEYEAFWKSQRLIDVASYFPDGMRSAGSVYDELTSTEAITRVGVVAMNEFTWTQSGTNVPVFYLDGTSLPNLAKNNSGVCVACAAYTPVASVSGAGSMTTDMTISVGSGDSVRMYVRDERYSTKAEFNAATTDALIFYPLATPTVTPIDPPLNLTYRTEQGGTERVMVPTGETSAPPTIVAAQGYTAESLRDAALSCIAPVENGKASTNYGIGSYLVHAGQLCKVTTAIATGESITIGTNVTTTTVMAEVLSLTQ